MRWARLDSPTLMASNREGIAALELEQRVELMVMGSERVQGGLSGRGKWSRSVR